MTTDSPRDGDCTDHDNDGRRGNSLGAAVRALSAVVGWAVSSDHVRVDGDVTVGSLNTVGPRPNVDRWRPTRHRRTPTHEERSVPIDARVEEDAAIVTADIRGIDLDDLAVGVRSRSGDFVVAEAGTPIARVSLPWRSGTITATHVHNDVLTVRIKPDNLSGGSEDR